MAHFFVWMASFFAMAIFWKYMGFARSTRKDEDFLLVQSEYYKRLCNIIPSLEKCLKEMEASSKLKVLNKNQCVHLFGKLIKTMKGIKKLLSTTTQDLKFQSIFEELCCLQKKIEIVGRNCTKQDRWCHAVVFQFQNKETFRELILDLKCCYNTAWDMYLFHHPNQSNDVQPIEFDAATYEQVLDDEQVLKKKLQLILQEEVLEDYEIAQHLLLRLRNLDRVNGGDLDALEIPNDFKTPNLIKEIGIGSHGHVYKSNWLGLECATKILEGNLEYLMECQKEPGILAGLNHPNLVQFFGCGIKREIDKNLENDERGEMHLMMELMESSLSTILKKAKRPLPYSLAIDIMHQIAKGVYYLHDMQVAHLDLKPDNILSSATSMEDLGPHHIFKVTDYGTSQLEVCSHPKHPKPSKYTIGSLGYMAPEMIKESNTPVYPFQADVWSFAMICSEILSRKVPYHNLGLEDFNDQMLYIDGTKNKRLKPDLPNNCKELTNLIEECWAQDPLQRPTFSNICERLISLKKSFLKGTYSYKMVPQFGLSQVLKDSKSITNLDPKVDEQIAPPKKIAIDLGQHLSKAKRLLKMSYLGIVGMGGIGKTTLAKAIFDDGTVNSLYDASCFVAQIKNYSSSYEIMCEILPKLGNDHKPKNLRDAQKMMKEIFVEKKILLILDDVNEEALMHDIVPLNIVQASKGTTIILTTRKWSTIKSFVGNEGRLDVELLDERAATTLFTTHLAWGVDSLSLDFVALRKYVVKACNGLPLSLKVIGAFLHNKKRLRSWERALQRMARGRNLDGDEEIWNTLKISFDGLKNDIEKRMFLDVACFFCGDVYPCGLSKETILFMWSKDGILPMSELDRLIDMSLLNLNRDGKIIEMHDQLRDMGRKIAKGTRIWNPSMIPECGFIKQDVDFLEGISWQGTMNDNLPLIKNDQSFAFKNLRVLIVESIFDNYELQFNNINMLLQYSMRCLKLETLIVGHSNKKRLSHIFSANIASTLNKTILNLCGTCTSLKILDLSGLGFLTKLPNNFASSSTLLRLDMSYCCGFKSLPQELGNLTSLITLNLRGCSHLMSLPQEIGNLISMTTLNLRGCSSLATLPIEIQNLTSLTTLDLNGCSRLITVPKEVGKLTSLTTLDINGCSRLTALPKEMWNLIYLVKLYLYGYSSLMSLPKEVGKLTSLTSLHLNRCSSLVSLPKEVGKLTFLTTLKFNECSRLVSLPKEIGNLIFLTKLYLDGCSSLVSLPKEIGNFASLTSLHLSRCSSLVSLPKELGKLTCLTTLNLFGCSSLVALPNGVGNLTSLTTLNLDGCSSLVSLPKEVGNLYSLTILHSSGCASLVSLPKEVGNLTSLTTLNLYGCSSLVSLPSEVGNLTSLTLLHLSRCSSLMALRKEVGNLTYLTTLNLDGCSSLVSLPKEVANLTSLTTLDLGGCSSLVSFPKEVANLTSLTTLDLGGCSRLVSLPKEVGNLTFLTTLNLNGCSSLVSLPKEVGNLTFLTTFNLDGCSSLVSLPKEVGNLTTLTSLHLSGCLSLVSLPKEVGNLIFLTTLNLDGCSSLVSLPKEVGNLIALTSLYLSGCSSLVSLPKEVGNLTSLTTLHLSWCSSLVSLPKEVGNLTSLIKLYLYGCSRLVALPKEIENLTLLTTLNLTWCSSLMSLPKEVGNLTSLTTLKFNDCSSLVSLPKEVGKLTSLTTLYLYSCSKFVSLPKEVGNLTSLITLNLDGCSRLVALPKKVENLTSLTTLDLGGCSKLIALGKEVGNLNSLKKLSLVGCSSLTTLPTEVRNLYSLTSLNFGKCSNLVSLPKEFGNLSSLTTLRLDGCLNLVALPIEVWNLSSLKTLDLGGCSRLVALPKEVGNLTSLTTLFLDGCLSLSTLPREMWNLSFLTTLHLGGCLSLLTLPMEEEN